MNEFSTMLQSCFDLFKDEKDEGSLALTPLYLMLGCVTPFWIYPSSFENIVPLPVFSGVLSIAVGDTAASICGSSFGKYRWLGKCRELRSCFGSIIDSNRYYPQAQKRRWRARLVALCRKCSFCYPSLPWVI